MTSMVEIAPGVLHFPVWLDVEAQQVLREEIRAVVRAAPFFRPRMPRTGKEFSVQMTNCGALGWVSDERGYRYQPTHPATGKPWPAMTPTVLKAWAEFAPGAAPAEACLVNFYAPNTKMGLHQDRDEADLTAPVVSLSLGDEALFRFGGVNRSDPTRSFRLRSGDAMILFGPARLAFHGVDRIIPSTTEQPGRKPGRLNLTLRRVNPR